MKNDKYDEIILPHLGQIMVFRWNDLPEDEIRDILGFDKKVWASAKKSHPEFATILRTTRETADAEVESSLYRKAIKGETAAIKLWLTNRLPEKWGDRKTIEHTGTTKVEIQAYLPDNGRGVIDVTPEAISSDDDFLN